MEILVGLTPPSRLATVPTEIDGATILDQGVKRRTLSAKMVAPHVAAAFPRCAGTIITAWE
jgi:hypothetical protein